MKQIIAILLGMFVLLAAFRDMVFLVSFRINQQSIAENLCVNRDKPMTMCAGKCILEKTIQQSHERKSTPTAPAPAEDRETFQFFIFGKIDGMFRHLQSVERNILAFEKNLRGILLIFDVFHPPRG